MSREIEIVKDPYDPGVDLFSKDILTLNEGLTILVGGNGRGKSTLLRGIANNLEEEGIAFVYFDSRIDGVVDLEELAKKMGKYAGSMVDEQDEYWFLLDDIDSGLSINQIVAFKYLCFNVIKWNPEKKVYILVSGNTYELCRKQDCLDVYTGEYREFESYDEYRKFIFDDMNRDR